MLTEMITEILERKHKAMTAEELSRSLNLKKKRMLSCRLLLSYLQRGG